MSKNKIVRMAQTIIIVIVGLLSPELAQELFKDEE